MDISKVARDGRLALLAVVVALPACVSDASIRAVRLTTTRPPRECVLVVEHLLGHGSNRERAAWDLRKRALKAGADWVVPLAVGEGWDPVTEQVEPWTFGQVVTLSGDAYDCRPR